MRRNKTNKIKGPFLIVRCDLLHDKSFCELPASTQIIYLEIMAIAGQQHSDRVRAGMTALCSYDLLGKNTRLDAHTISRSLKKLIEARFIEKVTSEWRWGKFGPCGIYKLLKD